MIDYKSNTIDDLNNINAFINQMKQDNFLFAIQYRRFDEKHIKTMMYDLQAKTGILQAQLSILDLNSDDWLLAFCTDEKGKYSEADRFIKTIGGSTKTMVDIAKKYQLKNTIKKVTYGHSEVSGWGTSFISQSVTQPSLFKDKLFPDYVYELFDAIMYFSSFVTKGINVCKEILQKEQKIKTDWVEAKRVFDYFKSKVILMVKDISFMIDSDELNPMIGMWENMKGDNSFYSQAYHQFSMRSGKNFICYLILEEGKRKGLENDAIHVFGINPQIVSENNYIIDNFDTIVGKMRNGNPIKKLPIKYIAYFLSASHYKCDYKDAVQYFYDHYKNGNYQLPKQHSVYSGQTNMDKESPEYKQFLIYREDLLSQRQNDLTIGNNVSQNLEYSRS